MPKTAYFVSVSGKVQGVGFRYYTAKQAQKLGITGYVKNLSDGSVELQIFGEQKATLQLLQWLAKGPLTAIVTDLKVTQIQYNPCNDFLCH